MLPMSGCDVVQNAEKLTFTIRHINRNYQITCDNETDAAEWMVALILSANAKLPTEILYSNVKRSTSMDCDERNVDFNNAKNQLKIMYSQNTN